MERGNGIPKEREVDENLVSGSGENMCVCHGVYYDLDLYKILCRISLRISLKISLDLSTPDYRSGVGIFF